MSTADESATPLGDQVTVDAQRRRSPARAASRIGRFSVLHRVGAGGMGEVLAAYDDQLDRKVAIKLVAPHVSVGSRGRVRREAQAMARVDHDNVLRVYEAGEHDGQTFIAMEYVEGQDLRAWQDDAPRTWQEILAVYVQAGRGLAAAHEAGLVHRDFKPHNAMIDASPPLRVRVLDFGLAGRGGEPIVPPTTPSGERVDSFATPLTRTGDIMGTPAYMAPEQIAGTPATAQADQFSFCVALWEALFGERPYGESKEVAEQFANVLDGEVRPPPAGADVPGWLPSILRRGLEVDPDDRWPNMTALLDELSRDRNARRRRVGIGVLSVLAIGSAVAAGQALGGPGLRCEGSDDELDAVWNDARRLDVRNAMAGPPDRLVADLDRYAQQWRQSRLAACEATRAGTQTEVIALARLQCLDVRKRQLAALIDVLADEASPVSTTDALESIERLPRVSSCADLEYLAAEVPPPEDPEVQRRVDEVQETMARARALSLRGHDDDEQVLALYEDAKARADEIGYDPLIAEAHHRLALTHRDRGDADAAKTHILAAYELLDVASKQTQSDILAALALIHRDEGDHDLALAEARRSAAILERALGPDSPELMVPLRLLAHAHKSRGDFQSALAVYQRVQVLGNSDPNLSMARRSNIEHDLGQAYDDLGQTAKSLAHYDRALELRAEYYGEDSVEVAMVLANRGVAQARGGPVEEGQADLERALEIRRARLPANHPLIGEALDNLGTVLHRRGELDRAVPLLEEALAIRERAVGPEHIEIASVLNNLAAVQFDRGHVEESLAFMRRAERIRARELHAEHPLLATTRENLAVILLRQGLFQEASGHAKAADTAFASREDGSERAARARRLSGDIALAAGDFDEARRLFRATFADWDGNGPLQLEGRLALVDFAARHFERAAPAFVKYFDALADAHDMPSNANRLAAAWAISAHRTDDDEAALRARTMLDDVSKPDDPLRELVTAELDGTPVPDDLADRLRAEGQWEFVPLAER